MLLILLQNKRKLNPLICTLQSWTLKIFIRKCPKVFPVPCWLIVVDLLIFLWFMFVSLHRAMTLKSLKLPIPANLNRSLRSVLDCYHWLPKSKGEIEENGSSWCISILSKASWCILWYILPKLILMISLIGKVTFPPRKRIDCLILVDCSDFGSVFPVKELEEGEIPGCWTVDVHCSVQEEQETVSRRCMSLEYLLNILKYNLLIRVEL